jgi:hypothetical protein
MKGNLNEALRETGIDAKFHTSRNRSYDEFLPWSIVDSGLSFEFLKTEHEKSQAALSSVSRVRRLKNARPAAFARQPGWLTRDRNVIQSGVPD